MTRRTYQDLIELRKLRRARQGIDVSKLNKGEPKKKKKAQTDGSSVTPEGLITGPSKEPTVEEDEERVEEAKARRVVRASNFTQQTNALDVDKHMMAYIEENMKLRHGSGEDEAAKGKSKKYDPQEELFRMPDKYKPENKKGDEGNVINSVAMLTAIPEVDLGMDTRLKNIEETEKAKRAVADERKEGKRRSNDDDEHLAATRFYKPNLKQKSDADIVRDAKLEAMGIRPDDFEPRQHHREKHQTATDDVVMERFKKRMRK